MKKLILSAAILLGSLSTFAASTSVQNTVKVISIADEYIEIKITDLPAAVTESLKKSHPDAVITKAYVNESKQYKLELAAGDKSETVWTDANGTIKKQ